MSHSGAEFFSQLRSFAATLDKDCNELKSKIENDEVSSESEGRAHLILRESLEDVQHFKAEVKEKVTQIKANFSFSEVLSACEKLAEQQKTQIEDLQEHLAKYGYKSLGELPSLADYYNENKSDSNSTMDTDDDHHVNQSNDDNENDTEADKMSTNEEPYKDQNNDADDMMSTPVKPVTFTPMIQATPPLSSMHTIQPITQDQSPIPPQTTTPMIQTKTRSHVNQTLPQYDSPLLPATYTPMLNRRVETGQNFDSPLPPMLKTPGLKMLGSHHHSVPNVMAMQSPDVANNYSPVPPDVTSTVLLRPEDLDVPKMELFQEESNRHDDVEEKYHSLPPYLQKNFTINEIKYLLQQIDQHLYEHGCNSLDEDTLREKFNLGYKTKAFMLILNKFGKSNLTQGELTF